jgi:UMF1 family MFS transporter
MDDQKKAIWGWAMYDWANSAFMTTVVSGFFPVFFKLYWNQGVDPNTSTARLGWANSIASLIIALMAPLLGAAADRGTRKKRFLVFFAYLGCLMTAGLFLVHEGNWQVACLLYVFGLFGFSGSNIFYDSLLPTVARNDSVDRVSGLGYGMGYLGGGLLFLLNVIMYWRPGIFGLASSLEAVRYAFLTVAIWWAGFTLITIAWVQEEETGRSVSLRKAVVEGVAQVLNTLRKIRYLKTAFLFLVAYWLYIDGVDTIIRMAVDYGMSLGFGHQDLVLALLLTQFVAFPAAIFYSRWGQRIGVRRAIMVAIGIYMLVTVWGVFIESRLEFYGLAMVIGSVQGGIQALSRSYFTRLIPRGRTAEFFGFYNMLGKFAAILGPFMVGLVGLTARWILMPESPSSEELVEIGHAASRWSIGSLLLLFVAGGILLYLVDEVKGRREAEEFLKRGL